MPIIKCGDCGRRYGLKPEQLGQMKCRCGAILGAPDIPAGATVSAAPGVASGAAPPAPPVAAPSSEDDRAAVARLKTAYAALREEIAEAIVGQDQVVEEMLIAVFARGHCLLEGVPGLAKTLLVSTLARALALSFKRIQFTPDLMPADVTGTEVIQEDKQTGERVFRFIPGPLFANIILADEINRTPPKTQAALLEAMQEQQVTAGGKQYPLALPFFVLATQNPLEQEGTYPLPEAQLDRFFFKILVDYPSADEELEIMRRVTSPGPSEVRPTLDAEEVLKLQELVLRVPVADHVLHYARKLVRSTRPGDAEAPGYVKDWIRWGAGPRASRNLILAGKARAILNGQYHVSCDDVAAVAPAVMRHRLACNFTAQAEGLTTDRVIERLIQEIPQTRKLEAAAPAAPAG